VVVALISSLSPPRRLQSFGDAGFSVGTDPDPARLGLNRLHVRLTGADGKPIDDGRVELRYGLETEATLRVAAMRPAAAGLYDAEVEFDKPGPWQVILTLKREGAPDSSATLLYNISPSSGAGKVVAGTVRIAPRLAGRVGPGDILYVIARRGPGPPLAVKRIANPAFPVAFRLSQEDMVMARGPFEGEVSIVARVRKGGIAGPAQPGDLEGSPPGQFVRIGDAPIDIVIDREI
ncbi:MAG: c-type cytochrome biogenesis protein CcmI/CycH, partial [Candidatus Methylomirabilaceae bacterium]